MPYIIKEEDHFLRMEDYVKRFDIYVSVERVGHIDLATEYSSKELAEEHINKAKNENGEDVSKMEVLDKEEYLKAEKEKAQHQSDAIIANGWDNTSEEKRREMIQDALDNGGSEALKKFFEHIINGSNDD